MPQGSAPLPNARHHVRTMAKFRPWLTRPERRILALFGSSHGWHRQAHRLIPILFLISAGVWVFAGRGLLTTLTPWVGAAALLGAGGYLARVVMATGRASLEAAYDRGTLDAAVIRRLRTALLQALTMVVGTILLGVGFLFVSLRVLAEPVPLEVPGLLWALCLGGFLLSLFIGELVMRLAETLESGRTPLDAGATGAKPRHRPPVVPEGTAERAEP